MENKEIKAENLHHSGNSIKPVLAAGQMVKLDADMENSSWVKLVRQTEGRIFAEVENADGSRWWVMSYRLTLHCG